MQMRTKQNANSGFVGEKNGLLNQHGAEKSKVRDSNLELLRIVAMFMIIAHHCVLHGGAYTNASETNILISYFFIPGGKLGFDAFLALSMWFLVDRQFSSKRFLKMWTEVFFYSVVFAGVSVAFAAGPVGAEGWVGVFFPMIGNSHGFAAAYLVFYLLIPFLNKLMSRLTKAQTGFLLAVVFLMQVVSVVLGSYTQYYQQFPSEIILFVFIYILMVYLKRYPLKMLSFKSVTLGIFVACWGIVFTVWVFYNRDTTNEGLRYFWSAFMNNESSLLYIVGGVSLFFFFKNLKIPKSKVINFIAKPTFGVLLIHDHNFFRYPFWSNIVHTADWYTTAWFPLIVLGVSAATFIGCGAIELLRAYLLERPLFRIGAIDRFCKKIDMVLNKEPQAETAKVSTESIGTDGGGGVNISAEQELAPREKDTESGTENDKEQSGGGVDSV